MNNPRNRNPFEKAEDNFELHSEFDANVALVVTAGLLALFDADVKHGDEEPEGTFCDCPAEICKVGEQIANRSFVLAKVSRFGSVYIATHHAYENVVPYATYEVDKDGYTTAGHYFEKRTDAMIDLGQRARLGVA